ncbi:DNA polymerase subunit gamma-1, partial [Fasciola gigantica]
FRIQLLRSVRQALLCHRHFCKSATAPSGSIHEEPVFNEVQIQMFSREHQAILFGSVISKYGPPPRHVSADLEAHGITLHKRTSPRPPVRFLLPHMNGANVKEHFYNVAKEMVNPYLRLLSSFPPKAPSMPHEWSTHSGWTRYFEGHCSAVEAPLEDVIFFDTEVLLSEGNAPTMAVAFSPIAWYSWVSPTLTQNTGDSKSPGTLIRLSTKLNEARCVVGHFVSYDRARVVEEYLPNGTKTRFIDTLALHVAVSGLTSTQRHLKTTADKQLFNNKLWQKFVKDHGSEATGNVQEKSALMVSPKTNDLQWIEETSLNNLTDVYKLYCSKEPPQDKTARSVFTSGTREEVCARFQELMHYCATDVLMTFEIFQVLFPLFQKRFPHPATLYGLLEMGSMYLPITDAWSEFQERADRAFADNERRQRELLMQLATQALDRYRQPGSDPRTDPWLWDLDWSRPRVSSAKTDADKKLATLPKWYRELIPKPVKENVDSGPCLLTAQMRIAPKLLRLCWQGLPIHYDQELKWGFLIPGRAPQPYGDPRYYEDTPTQSVVGEEKCIKHVQTDLLTHQLRALIPVYKKSAAGETELIFPYRAYLDYWLTEMKRRLIHETTSASGTKTTPIADSSLRTAYAQRAAPDNRDDQLMDELQRSIQSMPLDYEDRERLISTIMAIRVAGGTRETKYIDRRRPEWGLTRTNDPPVPIHEHLGEMQARGPAFWSDTKRYDRNGSASISKKSRSRRRTSGTNQLALDTINPNIPCCWFCHLPHESGAGLPVGSPLSKAFQSHVAAGRLHSAELLHNSAVPDAPEPVGLATQLLRDRNHATFWQSYSKRVKSQMTVWLQPEDLPIDVKSDPDYNQQKRYGAILPQVITSGTVSRRAVEPLWLTASNADRNRLGSEIKALVQTPPGYCFVGADVDSQEMWIAALIGDASVGFQGATPYGWMTLEGSKKDGTDLHTKIAKIMGITRNEAKVLNYARLYGSGFEFTKHLLAKFSNLTPEQASIKASQLLRTTKGQRVIIGSSSDKSVDRNDPAYFKKMQSTVTTKWQGGTESAVFNQLERIARSPEPQTPVLGAHLTRALNPQLVKEDFLPSRINWVVQSSAVDYLHCMLVIMGWLIQLYQLPARLCISIHDEVRYICRRDAADRVALALQISNLFTRCLFAYQLGMRDLPESVAYFSSVEVDTCLRKNPDDDCVTPSQCLL